MLITLAVAMPFMLETLVDFTHKLQDRIVHIE
jgi:flagellar biosynthesis protein FliQ